MCGDSSYEVMSESINQSRSALPECTKQNVSRAIKEVSLDNLPHLQVQLGISTTQMSEIDKFSRSGDHMKNMTIGAWFQQDQSPSWGKLIEALEKSYENVIAKNIKDGIIFIESSHNITPLQLVKADSQDSGSLSPLSPADELQLPRARTKSKISKKYIICV